MRRRHVGPGIGALIGMLVAGGTVDARASSDPTALPEPQPMGLAARPLLLEPAVQRDLKVTASQRERLANLDVEANQARQAVVDPDGEGADFAAALGRVQQVELERTKAVGRILTAAQKSRLTQLEWQREGWPALGRPEVAGRLKLPQDQKDRLAQVLERLRRDEAGTILSGAAPAEAATGRKLRADLSPANGFIDPGGGGFADGGPLNFSTDGMSDQERRQGEAIERLRREASREVDKLLTESQKAEFLAMLGPRFDFRLLTPGGPAAGTEPIRTERGVRSKTKR